MEQEYERAKLYRVRAAEMQRAAENAETPEIKTTFHQLEASWLRLAKAAENAADFAKKRGRNLT